MAVLDSSKPLGLPDGSVRAIIALMFTATLCAMFVTQQEINDVLLGISSVIVGAYFGTRGVVSAVTAASAEEPLAKPYVPNEDSDV